MSVLRICGVALVVAAACLLLDPEKRRWVVLAAAAGLLGACLLPMDTLLSFLHEAGAEGMGEAAKPLFQGIGVGCLCGISASALRESGADSAARALELYGRLQILLLAIPLLRQLLQIARALLC